MCARQLGKDPLTWSFVRLFGLQVNSDLHPFEGLPDSHAWRWKTAAGLWRARLLTKAQCSGVVVSIVERSGAVEFLIDDGTALVKAVLWGEGVHAPVALGDLVHVEGKLNVDKNWDAPEQSRELRVLRISKVEDPNEELLHWTQVMELTKTFYSAAATAAAAAAAMEDATTEVEKGAMAQWEGIAADAFFNLCISPSKKQQFLSRSDRDGHDGTLLETLESFLLQQKTSATGDVVGVTFGDLIDADAGQDGTANKNRRIRALQCAFRRLRRAGLLFLEDDAADRHILLSFEVVLKPALLQLLRDNNCQGLSIAEIADAMLTQERFKSIPLQWIETSLELLVAAERVAQREESQLFFPR